MTKRSDITKLRRKEIFDAAVKVISQKGFHGATVREIAAEAGLGKGTIYVYIRKKEDLITLIAEEGISLWSERIVNSFSPDDTPEEKLRKMIGVKLEMIRDHSMLVKTMAMEMPFVEHENSEHIEKIYEDTLLKGIAEDIRQLLPPGRFADGDALVMADILMHMCFLWSHSEILQKHAGDIDTYKRILTNLFLYGLNPDSREA